MAKINWDLALTRYIQDSSLSYADIGKEFGVTSRAVATRGKKGNWPRLRQETTAKLQQDLPQKTADDIIQANKQDVEMAKMFIGKGLSNIQQRELDPDNWEKAKDSITTGIGIRRKALGLDQPQATSAVQIIINNPKAESWGQ